MTNPNALKIAAQGEREIVITRTFDAPSNLVFDAFTKPELVSRWMFGPDGWSFVVCEIDLKVGGKYRYVWRRRSDGYEMGMGGVFKEVVAAKRLVSTEKFDEAWYAGEAVGTIDFVEKNGKTSANYTLRYESRDARDGVLKSPMEEGMAAGFDRLEKILISMRG